MGAVDAMFSRENREQILLAIERETDRLHHQDDQRTMDQQRADAFTSIIRAYNSQNIHLGVNQPHISIHCDIASWTGERIAGIFETSRGTHLSRETVMRLACNATISVITHDGNTIPLNMYRAERTFTKAQRRALEYRDRVCRFPGCQHTARYTEAHHVNWWELGGQTNLENAVLVCYRHHRLVHDHGWTIKIDSNADVHWYQQDGTHHSTSHPHPPPT